MAKNRILYAAALAGTFLFYCCYSGWIAWFLLMLALCLPLFSLLCSLPAMHRCTISVQLPVQCGRGEDAVLTLQNSASGVFPTPTCRFTLSCTDRLSGRTEKTVCRFTAWSRRALPLDTAHCGAYVYALERGRICDYLGLFSFHLRLPDVGTLFVLPQEQMPQPLPNLSRFQTKSYRPKYGGGFSELHDLRPYRPGDCMRDVHWKLSAKTDALVVREAQEPNRGEVILTLDLVSVRETLDRTLDMLCWLSRWLLAHETAHLVCWLRPEDCEPMAFRVLDEASLDTLLLQLLEQPLREQTPSIADRPFPHADWRYHIHLPEEQDA